MTRDEAEALVYAPILNALNTALDQDWCVSHAVHLATEATATVIQQAFAERFTLTAALAYDAGKLDGLAERDGEIERLTKVLSDIQRWTSPHPDEAMADQARNCRRANMIARQALAAKGDSRG